MSITVTSGVSCEKSDELRQGLRPLASITNYVAGEALNPHLPPITQTTWGGVDGRTVLEDRLSANGCRHWHTEYLGEEV